MTKPGDGQTVWIEYPEGKHFQAVYDAASDSFRAAGGDPIAASDVRNWSVDEHEDYDISDEPAAPEKGKLTRS